ncbi:MULTISPECIES: PQQ-dependent sugar dehydrogenase [Metabacillus]|uniref:Quinoprotein glucose dehydrogenase n=2 Tax=Metabacillus TaxID=2675233 RepID=A0A179SMC8_9BACI|nr:MULTISPECIES: PQQ-dependent sugar dehydrogenase [Metabacillus]OAS82524.1 quinoprotein glucose dehydrogenase [Metabacillus litoralis]QNF26709.1 PQQ-dependent sugar dehydrogenase [Metabacillus sp. KUDC1714]
MYKGIKTLMLLLFVTGCSFGDKTQNRNDSEKQVKLEAEETIASSVEVLATNLHIPWTITKKDGTFFISQREGKIIETNLETGLIKKEELSVTKDILHEGEGGLLGLVLAPDFESSGQAFAYYTYKEDLVTKNRVIALQQDGEKWTETKVLLEGIPGGRIHNGGRMRIGPDGMLYVTTGDSGNPDLSQDKKSLAGKILRMNLDGTIPNDNPFENSYVYSYGHRNPQGLAWDDEGILYSTEHGQSAHDEINLIKPGQNYGWPVIQGDEEEPGMEKPIYHTGENTWAPSGIGYHNGKLYIATLRDSKIRSFDILTKSVNILHENSGRMRDVYIEQSQLYTITNNRDGRGTPKKDDDKLLKIGL